MNLRNRGLLEQKVAQIALGEGCLATRLDMNVTKAVMVHLVGGKYLTTGHG